MNYTEYRKEVKTIAQSIVQERRDYGDRPLEETIWETIDSSSLVIYNTSQLQVIEYSDHSPADCELWRQSDAETFWDITQPLASELLRLDVLEYLREHSDLLD